MRKSILFIILSSILLIVIITGGCGGGGGDGDGADGDGDGDGADTTPPTVVSTVPAADATGVAINSAITATFSEDMDPATITASTFTLEEGNGGLSAGGTRALDATVTYTASSRTATLTPAGDFTSLTGYTATITTGVTDTSGNALAQAYTWSFTSGQAPDTTPPEVVSTFPEDGAVEVSPDITEITVTFNEDMDPETMHQDSCGIVDTESSERLGGVSLADRTLVLYTDGLRYNSTYEGYVQGSVSDLAGNGLGEDYTWTFSTEVDTVPPTIVDMYPHEDPIALDMIPRTPIAVTFDDDMNPSSIDYDTFWLRTYPEMEIVDGGITYEDGVAYYTPNGDLDFRGYYFTVDNGIEDKAGNNLDLSGLTENQAYSWIFERRQAGEPELNEGQDTYHIGYPRVAVRPSGEEDYVLVWVQIHDEENGDGTIWADYWDVIPEVAQEYRGNAIVSGGEPWTLECAEPRVVIDGDGNAMAVWLQGYMGNGYYENVYASVYSFDETDWYWEEPVRINVLGEISTKVQNLDVAAFDTGGTVAVWDQITDDGETEEGNIWSNYCASFGAWEGAEQVSVNDASWGYANSPCIVLDSVGNGRAFWHQHYLAGPDGGDDDLHPVRAREGSAGEGWNWAFDVVPLIDEISDTTKQTEGVVAAQDGSGNYMALWLQDDDEDMFPENLYASHYYEGFWGTPEALASHTDGTIVTSVDFDFSGTGSGMAVWMEQKGFLEEVSIRSKALNNGGSPAWSGVEEEIYVPDSGLPAVPVVRYLSDDLPVCVFGHTDLQTYARLMYTKHDGSEWVVHTEFESDPVDMDAMQVSGDNVYLQYVDEISIGIDTSDFLHVVWPDGPEEFAVDCESNHFWVGTPVPD